MSQVPPRGVWCPAVTFFNPESDTIDLEAQARYFSYLSTTGLAGLVILGTNAETMLLTREERRTLVQTARRAVGPTFPLMAGVGGHSTAQVLEFISDAAEAGANSVLVLPPAYFGPATTPQVLENFYGSIADRSALPVIIYNFPGVCNGVDLDSDFIAAMANRHKNIVGVKLTCGSVAKIARLAAVLPKERFAVFGGQSDFIIGGLASGSSGCIAAFANVFPKTIARIYALYQDGKTDEALALHQKAALAEQPIKAGIAATKYAAALHSATDAGIRDAASKLKPRQPYVEPPAPIKERVKSRMAEVAKLERSFPAVNKPITAKI
ncbi:dihydrodipicolinate synthetase [Cucurbitaria berberidis CBS 394.84]|uniref:Dihydrodipicolinate synthetase n=1 Tax=Cucurbitaria berberidis CBS 394.84 TaxID=1168544 RepID=A0A9P4LF36_9PLEO|nr:dihydrodipicolinate synthetase [Cucurbitaria berberidis CBS 394.84]KAF1851674.1 dihydrodipicolinate synthetase [Cucurbitaria berberidis CBS 394.84]